MYNSIKAAEVAGAKNSRALAAWKCAFIHDAISLHLLHKRPSIAEPAYFWLLEPEVAGVFDTQDRVSRRDLILELAITLERTVYDDSRLVRAEVNVRTASGPTDEDGGIVGE